MITLPSSLDAIIETLIASGVRPVVVGGYVRDTLLKKESKDIDIELFGISSLSALERLLQPFGKVNVVGRSFGVLKLQLKDVDVDFSLPRQEKKVASGHKGFEVQLEGTLSFKAAALRRDFTINAMGYDLKTKELLDPFYGYQDLLEGRLDIVDAKHFVEDPLRLYRAMQFLARFALTPSPRLLNLAKKMVSENMLEELPKERVFEEFKKLLLKSERPSIGFNFMYQSNMLSYFPELHALIALPQNPKYHPEGDVWTHTLMVVDEVSKRHGTDAKENLYLSLAALCHDLGKAETTECIEGQIRSIGHESKGVPLSEHFLRRLSDEKQLFEVIAPLVQHHLKPMQFYLQGAKSPAIRRLAKQVNIERLVRLAEADYYGRGIEMRNEQVFEAGQWLLERCEALHVRFEPLSPILQGRDLIAAGLQPSKAFKSILERAYEAQLEGEISDHKEALIWLDHDLK